MNRHPILPHVTRFAVGVLTAPRDEATLPGTLRSLTEAGFDRLHVFAEPNSPVATGAECVVIRRPNTVAPRLAQITPQPDGDQAGRFGNWQNYLQALADLLKLNPEAQALVIAQDDIAIAPGTRQFLESDLWPAHPVGLVSLYTPRTQERDRRVGCRRRQDWCRQGALCNVFPRAIAELFVNHPVALLWQREAGPAWLRNADDAATGTILRAMQRPAYSYVPSLVEHTGEQSSLGHAGNTGNRNARHPLRSNVLEHWTRHAAFPAASWSADGTRHSAEPSADYGGTTRPRIRPAMTTRSALGSQPVDFQLTPAQPEFEKPATPAPPADLQQLQVICCHFNPAGFAAPLDNLQRFLDRMHEQQVDVLLVHAVFPGDRSLDVEGARIIEIPVDHPARQTLWQKERLLNIAEQHLPDDVDAVAWIDADVLLPDGWPQKTLAALNRFAAVQPWRLATQSLPDGSTEPIEKPSVGSGSAAGQRAELRLDRLHPGFAWAMRRDCFRAAGGLLESMVTGGGDGLIASAFSGRPLSHGVLARLSPAWLAQFEAYRQRAAAAVPGPVGFVDQPLTHLWHGSRENRRYLERWDYLARDSYNPDTDLELAESGLLQWSHRALLDKSLMVAKVANYFADRREDDAQ